MTSSATQTGTIATITKRNYTPIPITIVHQGRLGYTAHLGMADTQFPRTKPPWNKPANRSRMNDFAFKVYIFVTNSPQHHLNGVNT